MADQIPNIAALLTELDAARIEMKEATQELRGSNTREMSARNKLNAAQHGIDRWYKLQKKDAPEDSDWAKGAKP